MGSRLPEYHVEHEKDEDGFLVFVVVDEYGEHASRFAHSTVKDAEAEIERLMKEDRDNYDGPPDGDAWSGGFAENH
jgi:hypothetical protein